MSLPDLTCDVCGKPALGVCNALGPFSCAFCQECLQNDRFPYSNLVGYLGWSLKTGSTKAELAEWVHPAIDATLAFYNKTWEEFVADCVAMNDDYDRYEEDRAQKPHEESAGEECDCMDCFINGEATH